MKANRSGMQPVALDALRSGAPCPFALYLYLPRNQRMVLLRRAGDALDPTLYQELANRPQLELWRADTAAEALAARLQDARARGELGSLAGELRTRVDESFRHEPVDDALLQEVLRFRCDQPADAHSVMVGTLSGTLAMEAGEADLNLLAQLLIASTFHDCASTLFDGSGHETGAAALLAEADFAVPAPVLEAIRRHHEAPDESARSVQRYLALAETMATGGAA